MTTNIAGAIFKGRRRTNETVEETIAALPYVGTAVTHGRECGMDGVQRGEFVVLAKPTAWTHLEVLTQHRG
ncbi:MAG: hypothetical protein JXQ99_24305 [Hyphomicrobiaceae bacterium]